MAASPKKSIAKLVSVLAIFPFTITYMHLQYYAYWHNEYCFVGPEQIYRTSIDIPVAGPNGNASDNVTDASQGPHHFWGIYSTTPNYSDDTGISTKTYQQQYATIPNLISEQSQWYISSWGWPSITQSMIMMNNRGRFQIGDSLLETSVMLLQERIPMDDFIRHISHSIVYSFGKWCLQSSGEDNENKWCFESKDVSNSNWYPPSGRYKSEYPQQNVPDMIITCPSQNTPNLFKKKQEGGLLDALNLISQDIHKSQENEENSNSSQDNMSAEKEAYQFIDFGQDQRNVKEKEDYHLIDLVLLEDKQKYEDGKEGGDSMSRMEKKVVILCWTSHKIKK